MNNVILTSAIITNTKKEILFLLRSKCNRTFKNYWQLPEGKIEIGESPEESLKREINEETGLDISQPKLINVNTVTMNILGTKYNVLRIIYKINKWKGEVALSTDHLAFKWCNLEQAKYLKKITGLREILTNIKI